MDLNTCFSFSADGHHLTNSLIWIAFLLFGENEKQYHEFQETNVSSVEMRFSTHNYQNHYSQEDPNITGYKSFIL